MIPRSIVIVPNGKPFAAHGETNPDRWRAVVGRLDPDGDNSGIVFLIEGAGARCVGGRSTIEGWCDWIEIAGADLVPDELLDANWRAIPARMKHPA